ncbi:MAG: TolC family protein [Gammaproteobacteria bacterium]
MKKTSILVLLLLATVKLYAAESEPPSLALAQAEEIALANAPELSQLRHNITALQEAAIAAGQMTDPTFFLGLINVPVDTFSLVQDEMTQIKFGVAQAFPKGKSLKLQSTQKNYEAQAEEMRFLDSGATIVLTVRNLWLDIYYWTQTAKIVAKNKTSYEYLVQITESMLAAGKNKQYDVLQAQLELSRVQNRQIEIQQEIAMARAQLTRWLGEKYASLPLPTELPTLKPLSEAAELQRLLQQHPLLKANTSTIAANQTEVALAQEQYKPGFVFGIGYGLRNGHFSMGNIPGPRRYDLISFDLGIDLPVFPRRRQDKELAATLALLKASEDAQSLNYRELKSQLDQQQAIWRQLAAQETLYQQQLVPESRQYTKASITAYQNGQAEFLNVVQAYNENLETQIQYLKIKVDQKKTRAALLYLEGET